MLIRSAIFLSHPRRILRLPQYRSKTASFQTPSRQSITNRHHQ